MKPKRNYWEGISIYSKNKRKTTEQRMAKGQVTDVYQFYTTQRTSISVTTMRYGELRRLPIEIRPFLIPT